jgi:hypothetical protein
MLGLLRNVGENILLKKCLSNARRRVVAEVTPLIVMPEDCSVTDTN